MTDQRRYHVLLLATSIGGIILLKLGAPCPAAFSQVASLSWLCAPVWTSFFHHPIPEAFIEIAHNIGEALIIATLLALIVDESAKRKLIKEFSLDISSYIIGRWLPEDLRKHLHEYLEMRLVRTSWDITYEIKKSDPGSIELSTSSIDVMENRLDKAVTYTFNYFLEVSRCSKGRSEITSVHLPGYAAPLSTEILQRNMKFPSGYCHFSHDMELEPASAKKVYSFKTETRECLRDNDSSLFYSRHPVIKSKLAVTYVEKEFDVSLDLTFYPTSPKPTTVTTDGLCTVTWTIDRPDFPPMLPGQGFLLKWTTKKAPPVATPPPAKVDAALLVQNENLAAEN